MLYDVSDACFFDVSEQKEAMVPEEEKRTGKKKSLGRGCVAPWIAVLRLVIRSFAVKARSQYSGLVWFGMACLRGLSKGVNKKIGLEISVENTDK